MGARTPFSVLHEWQQVGAIAFTLKWVGGSIAGWTARVTVDRAYYEWMPFSVAATGSSKQAAKQKAAGSVIAILNDGTYMVPQGWYCKALR